MTEAWVALAAAGVVGLFGIGLYAIAAKRNLVKVLLGMQILGKAATLTFVLAGFLLGDLGRAQAIVFTIVVIETVVVALALALMINVYHATGTLSVAALRRMRG
ncbi:MAG: NADH-quinone oxidoreductase subunit K [Candidatus Thermoplasmatota archaeon]